MAGTGYVQMGHGEVFIVFLEDNSPIHPAWVTDAFAFPYSTSVLNANQSTVLRDSLPILMVSDLVHLSEVNQIQRNRNAFVEINKSHSAIVDIYDSNGMALIRDGVWFYRLTPSGELEWVGEASPARGRVTQYTLSLDQYTFRLSRFHAPSTYYHFELTATTIIDNKYNSFVRYYAFQSSPHLELTVSPAITNLTNTLTRMVIEPTEIASPAELRRMNEGR